MARIFQIKMGEHRPDLFVDSHGVDCRRGDLVIVEVDRSAEYGRVITTELPPSLAQKPPMIQGRLVRLANEGDLRQIEHNRFKANDALHVCISKVNEMHLDMNILSAEYSFDASRAIFYFTAEGRVDFRELVKELARIFRVRIELKQVGVRDRAKMTGGFGVCGQELCCANFIKDFGQLSIKMAKEQALPLNPTKISGVCGRIKCCMAYEYNVYRELNKGLPKMGARVEIPEGRGRVISLDILKRLAYVDLGEGKIVKAPVPPEGLAKAPQMEPRREQRPDDRRPRPDEGRGRQPGQGRDRDRREPRENRDRNGRRP